MSSALTTIQDFRAEVLVNIGLQMIALDVVDLDGKHPVVAALADESLATLMRRVEMIGGYANVFVLGENHQVRQVSFLPTTDAVFADEADDMTGAPPAGNVSVGAFLDYVETQAHGVNVPAILKPLPDARAQNVRPVVLESA